MFKDVDIKSNSHLKESKAWFIMYIYCKMCSHRLENILSFFQIHGPTWDRVQDVFRDKK